MEFATQSGIMAQKPNDPAYSKDRMPPEFEHGGRRRMHAHAAAEPHATAPAHAPPRSAPPLDVQHVRPEPVPSAAGRMSGPFREAPPPEKAVSRRNPATTFAVVGGALAIVALVLGMLFSGPTYVDEGDVQNQESMQAREPAANPAP